MARHGLLIANKSSVLSRKEKKKMREILFRGKRVDNGKWVYGTYGEHTSLDATIIINRPYPTHNGGLSAINFWDVDPATVGQYTGLTDKNGTKIFEGDIIKTKKYGKDVGRSNVNDYDIFTVEYEPAMFRLENRNRSFVLDDDGCSKYEIIGNIHDNP